MHKRARIVRSDGEWRRLLTPEQYRVLRRKGTEPPFTGELLHNERTGHYVCAACANELFSSEAKYDSGSGWPSFSEQASEESVDETSDSSMGMSRIEVVCAKCGGHLGHVFEDGPKPTGRRYCVNSAALRFVPDEPAD